MRYLLDTNILIAMSKERPGLVNRLQNCPAGAILLSSVVLAEIEYGIAKSIRQEQNRRVYAAIIHGFQVVSFDTEAARQYGPLRANLEKRGLFIGPNDLMIAAQARALNAVLVTDNIGEFSRVEEIRVENWLV